MFLIPTSVRDVIASIANADPSISEIWLIGSRANSEERPNSDWDLLVFGGYEASKAIRSHVRLDPATFDVLAVYNGDDFQDPWRKGNRRKSGSLSGWKWRRVSESEAEYVGTRWDEHVGAPISRLLKGRRLWVRTAD